MTAEELEAALAQKTLELQAETALRVQAEQNLQAETALKVQAEAELAATKATLEQSKQELMAAQNPDPDGIIGYINKLSPENMELLPLRTRTTKEGIRAYVAFLYGAFAPGKAEPKPIPPPAA